MEYNETMVTHKAKNVWAMEQLTGHHSLGNRVGSILMRNLASKIKIGENILKMHMLKLYIVHVYTGFTQNWKNPGS